jgi:methanogenic corrinoid protein MtbC1
MLEETKRLFFEALLDTDRDRARKTVQDAVRKGVSPEEIVFAVVIPSIELMIQSISEHAGANLAQHFMTAQITAEVTEEMIPLFKSKLAVAGRVVIGSSLWDFHGLGKRIVIGCLKALMIDVTDLGLNVPPHRFVAEAIARNAEVIGISSMMVHTARGENACLKVRSILRDAQLEDKIKIIVGGAPYRYDPELYKTVQADAWAENGISAGKVITDLIKEVRI